MRRRVIGLDDTVRLFEYRLRVSRGPQRCSWSRGSCFELLRERLAIVRSVGSIVPFMLSASRPCQADQVLVAQTAIPPSCWNSGRPRYLGSGTISTTPGSLRASVASHDLTLPPTTGGRAITANSWFSRRASMAFPVTRSSRSTSGASLPIYFHFSRGFNVSGRQRELPESWQFRPARRIRYAGRHLCE